MAQRQRIYRGLQGLVLSGLVCLLVSCDDPGGETCGGEGSTVSCLEVGAIVPADESGNASSNVDAFQDICSIDGDGNPVFESHTDHNATVSFTNTRFPGATADFTIRVVGFAVSYSLNDCPATASGCPPLTGFADSVSLRVPAGATVSTTVPFVPLRVKDQYEDAGGAMSPPPSYTITYEFTAQTIPFNETITVEASREFTIGNFDLCGSTP